VRETENGTARVAVPFSVVDSRVSNYLAKAST
jgi:hypothetical protein